MQQDLNVLCGEMQQENATYSYIQVWTPNTSGLKAELHKNMVHTHLNKPSELVILLTRHYFERYVQDKIIAKELSLNE